MSDDVKHADDELFDDSAEESTDMRSDDVKHQNDASTNTLNLDDEEVEESSETPEAKSEKMRQQQVNAWVRKVESGEATLDDLSERQQWLVPLVKEKLGSKESLKKEDLRELAREEIARVRQEAEEDAKFSELRNTLQDLSLTRQQREVLEAKFKSLKPKLGKLEALQLAIEVSGVDLEDTVVYRRAMSTPRVGNGVKTSGENWESVDPNSMSSDKRYEMVQKLRGY